MNIEMIRPDESFDEVKRAVLLQYLLDQYKRAEEVRSGQVQSDYLRWSRNYKGIPAEKTRNVPWPKSSNIVVKVIRIFVDTFVARTLNIIFATRPLYTVSGFEREATEAVQRYLNEKALTQWRHYELTRDMLTRGTKNGTVVTKTMWEEVGSWMKMPPSTSGATSEDVFFKSFVGPKSRIIPFEDFMVYPVTVTCLEDAIIKFHKVRFVEEEALRRVAEGKWLVTEDEVKSSLVIPQDVKREEMKAEASLSDNWTREFQPIECHLEWPLGSDDRYYSIVALIDPSGERLVDVFFSPYPNIFRVYCPFPQEDFFWGESMCSLLDTCQEEATVIHNDRRNNSYLSNAPQFKRRNGSLLPNPSSDWYPGKVWDLESMEDLEVFDVGRVYDSMLDQEANVFQYAERLSGIGPVMQGNAAGFSGKRGVYNAMGTIALLQESNQRQDTNIRDVREVLSVIGRDCFYLQGRFGVDDPYLSVLDGKTAEQVRRALQFATTPGFDLTRFEVKASSAAGNKEVERQNLLQIASVLAQYGQSAQGMVVQLVNPQLNPGLRQIMLDTLKMQKWMAARLLRAFDEYDAEGVLPNALAAIEKALPGGSGKPEEELPDELPMESGGSPDTAGLFTREGLGALASLPLPQQGAFGEVGMGGSRLG